MRQFDTMVIPESKEKRWYDFFNIFGSDSKVPSPAVMRTKCLVIYLELYKNLLESRKCHASFDIHVTVKGFVELYECCYCQYIHKSDEFHDWIIKEIQNASYIIIIMLIVC